MALSVPRPPGVSQMMKDGARVSVIDWNNMNVSPRSWHFIDIFANVFGHMKTHTYDQGGGGSREIFLSFGSIQWKFYAIATILPLGYEFFYVILNCFIRLNFTDVQWPRGSHLP